MDTSKFISLLSLFLFLCCKNVTYTKKDDSFYAIHLIEWNSSVCPKKIVYEQYVKNSNFKKINKSYSKFNVSNCEDIYKSNNQRVLKPILPFKGQIDYDIKLIIDDSIEYKITFIENKIDTIFYGGRPGDFTIMNNITSFTVNGHKVDNSRTPLNIFIPSKTGKIIKKLND